MDAKKPPQQLTALDWLGLGLAGLNAVGFFFFPLVGKTFTASLKTLGGAPPPLTRIVFGGWFSTLFGLVTLGCVVAAATRPAWPISTRRALIFGSFLLGGIGVALCLVAAYSSYFSMVDAIQ
jgi:hypothetical protein